MAAGESVADCEELVRALYHPLWDSALGRATTRAFTQMNASVSRTAVLPYEEIVEILKAGIGADKLVATCTTTAATVRKACAEQSGGSLTVDVVEDPLSSPPEVIANPAHAEIRAHETAKPGTPVELTKAVARAILKCVTVSAIQPLAGSAK